MSELLSRRDFLKAGVGAAGMLAFREVRMPGSTEAQELPRLPSQIYVNINGLPERLENPSSEVIGTIQNSVSILKESLNPDQILDLQNTEVYFNGTLNEARLPTPTPTLEGSFPVIIADRINGKTLYIPDSDTKRAFDVFSDQMWQEVGLLDDSGQLVSGLDQNNLPGVSVFPDNLGVTVYSGDDNLYPLAQGRVEETTNTLRYEASDQYFLDVDENRFLAIPEYVEYKADYKNEYKKLPKSIKERPDVYWEDMMGGFVNGEGEVYRHEIGKGTSEKNVDDRWCVEMDRQTYQLIDKNGNPFTWTITLERVANYGLGRTSSKDITFNDEFQNRLQEFASKYLDGETLDGKTNRISYTPVYEANSDRFATQTYLQAPNGGQGYFGYGFNITESRNIHTRIYNGLGSWNFKTRPDTTNEMIDETLTTEDLTFAMIMIARSQEDNAQLFTENLLRPGKLTNDMYVVMMPVYKKDNFQTTTKIVDYR